MSECPSAMPFSTKTHDPSSDVLIARVRSASCQILSGKKERTAAKYKAFDKRSERPN